MAQAPAQNRGPFVRADPPAQAPRPHQQANTAATVRDRLFYALFERAAIVYARIVPVTGRRAIEFFLLLVAFLALSLLVYIHVAFIRTPGSCLNHFKWDRNGVLRVEMAVDEETARGAGYMRRCGGPPSGDYFEGQIDEHLAEHAPAYDDDVCHRETFLDFILGKYARTRFPDGAVEMYEPAEPQHSPPSMSQDGAVEMYEPVAPQHSPPSMSQDGAVEMYEPVEPQHSPPSMWDMFMDVLFGPLIAPGVFSDDVSIIEYAEEFGFLRLSHATRYKHTIPVTLVKLDLVNDPCFGGNLSRFLLDNFLGYDEIIMSSIKVLAERVNRSDGNLGYVRNVMTGEHFKYVSMSMTRTAYLASFLIMILFTFSISMLLRFAHHQLFVFIVELLQLMEMNLPVVFPAAPLLTAILALVVELLQLMEMNLPVVFPAAPLLTAILALVGMEAIMSEFFNDAGTAFYIILTVWIADQFDAICCHSNISKRHWLRFFFLYHFAFYAYHYRFNGQYGGMALLTCCLFIQHSMIYFFHHYELPAILQQHNIRSSIADIVQAQDGPNARVDEVRIQGGQPSGELLGTARVTLRRTNAHPIPVNQRREAGERIAALVVNDVIESLLRRNGSASAAPSQAGGTGPSVDPNANEPAQPDNTPTAGPQEHATSASESTSHSQPTPCPVHSVQSSAPQDASSNRIGHPPGSLSDSQSERHRMTDPGGPALDQRQSIAATPQSDATDSNSGIPEDQLQISRDSGTSTNL